MAFILYNSAVQDFFDGTQDWDTDSHYCILLQSSYTPSLTHSTVVDVSAHEVVEGDYSPKNMQTETVVVSGDDIVCDAADVNFGNPVTITTAQYAVIAVGTVGTKSNTDLLVGYVEIGSPNVVAGPLNISWDGTNGIFKITRAGGPDSVTTRDGQIIYFQEIADSDPNTLLFIAGQSEFPGIKDYGTVYTEEELCTIGTLKTPERRGLYSHASKIFQDLAYKESLRLSGEYIGRAVTDMVGTPGSTTYFDFGGGGGTDESGNYQYRLRTNSSSFDYFAERGIESGNLNNLNVIWTIPGGLYSSREYVFEQRRTATGDLTVYVNGYKLQRASDSSTASGTGITSDGTATGMNTDGGTSTTFLSEGLDQGTFSDCYWIHISNALSGSPSPSSYAQATGIDFTDAEKDKLFRDNFTTLAADPDAVIVLNPSSGTLVDEVGTIAAWDSSGTTSYLINNVRWTVATSGNWVENNPAALQITGDMSINVLFMYDGTASSTMIAMTGAATESEVDNFLYRLFLTDSNTINYLAEEGPGPSNNLNVNWDLPAAMVTNSIHEVRFVRQVDGGGKYDHKLYYREFGDSSWTQLNVVSASAEANYGDGTVTGVGTGAANADGPSGGTAADLTINDVVSYREIVIYDAAKNPI